MDDQNKKRREDLLLVQVSEKLEDCDLELTVELFGEARRRVVPIGRLFTEYMARNGTPRRQDLPLVEGASTFVLDARLPGPGVVPAIFYDQLADHGRGFLEYVEMNAADELELANLSHPAAEGWLSADGTFCTPDSHVGLPDDHLLAGRERHSLPHLRKWLRNARCFIGLLGMVGASLGRRADFSGLEQREFFDERVWHRSRLRVDFHDGALYLPTATLPFTWEAQYEGIVVGSLVERIEGGKAIFGPKISRVREEAKTDPRAGRRKLDAIFKKIAALLRRDEELSLETSTLKDKQSTRVEHAVLHLRDSGTEAERKLVEAFFAGAQGSKAELARRIKRMPGFEKDMPNSIDTELKNYRKGRQA